jgi:hypothetical protein
MDMMLDISEDGKLKLKRRLKGQKGKEGKRSG